MSRPERLEAGEKKRLSRLELAVDKAVLRVMGISEVLRVAALYMYCSFISAILRASGLTDPQDARDNVAPRVAMSEKLPEKLAETPVPREKLEGSFFSSVCCDMRPGLTIRLTTASQQWSSRPTWWAQNHTMLHTRVLTASKTDDMQQESIEVAQEAMAKFTIEKDIAQHIKRTFDERKGPTWHCIVGRNFGSFVTHETKHFIYFYLGHCAILLFKTQ
ncbi:hypothetical protein CDD80_546 [Ophiocordyceps camponoti-rufipedis]|uniref:Dynein light chain n=11 Tax=Hypocreomycetidae TaxID=222543 RepID=A0A2C5ZCM4_9HYPO|nr:hypothetical protein CDD80_546 [Ophiocordyceps camponoti-rufipedis]